jgi:hypothetical protein
MRTTPFQRALDRLENRIYRLPTGLRARLHTRSVRVMRRRLTPTHPAVLAFRPDALTDREVVGVAQAQGLRLWWLPCLVLWNSLTSGIDVAEYALAWFVVEQRWIPRRIASLSMMTAALIAADVRRAAAAPSRVPTWCLAWQSMPCAVTKVCARRLGVVAWWKVGADSTSDADASNYSCLPFALRVGMGVALLLLTLHLGTADAHPGILSAAISSTAVWEVQTGGSDNNGGGYNGAGSSPGTDYTQQTGAQVTIDGTVISATVQATTTQIKFAGSSGYTTAATDNRNVLQITGGTATAGFYEITAVTVGAPGTGVWTLDRSAGTSTQTVVGAMGGALISGGKAGGAAVSSNTIYVKNGTYSISSTTSDVAGGVWGNSEFSKVLIYIGYQTTRAVTTTDTPPLVQFGLASVVFANNGRRFVNIAIDGNGQTGARAAAGNGYWYRCSFTNINTASSANTYARCTATANSANVLVGTSGAFASEGYSNTATPFGQSSVCAVCLAYGNTGASTDGFLVNQGISSCVAYGNGRHGFSTTGVATFVNCIAEGNTGNGYNTNAVTHLLLNCAAYSNTGGNITASSLTPQIGFLTLSVSPFVNAAGNDFSLNTTTGGGASCRAAGYPGAFPHASTTGYPDLGAAQHADPTVLMQGAGMTGGMNG